MLVPASAFQDKAATWENIRVRIGAPLPIDAPQEKGGTLSLLELTGIGPASNFRVELADRLNIFTGDNGLGKTFILECAWWALTGNWTSSAVYPREDASKSEPQITFEVTGASGWPEKESSKYDWRRHTWVTHHERLTLPGLLIYARVDGAFAIWDPAGSYDSDSERNYYRPLILTREEVWDGLLEKSGGKTRSIFNGLINDWVDWQSNPKNYPFEILRQVLLHLSPPGLEEGDLGPLQPGTPVRIPGDRRLMPTIKHSYGEIPLVYASAAVRRIVAMAYLIVWAWEEHKAQSELIREEPQKRMVILIDEIEAHLHPQWQRIILPTLLSMAQILQRDIQVQFLITTHSPLVMVSMEPRFNPKRDKIFHLNLMRQNLLTAEVILEEPEFVRYGHVNSWLMSDIFELRHARALEAEKAIEAAKKLQLQNKITKEEVQQATDELARNLAGNDEFWPRWLFFAKQFGVEL
ncbi:MAG: AAA family ATPase [Chloroflexi bacterium]|nr:AAA family ATPase [Chloroflexota bacterium]MCI0649258.1 AAA family ATPase [Chloroflexota bacterium]MCI0728842.1 AAA family ATPase [Chloroflexota bacterium]